MLWSLLFRHVREGDLVAAGGKFMGGILHFGPDKSRKGSRGRSNCKPLWGGGERVFRIGAKTVVEEKRGGAIGEWG